MESQRKKKCIDKCSCGSKCSNHAPDHKKHYHNLNYTDSPENRTKPLYHEW